MVIASTVTKTATFYATVGTPSSMAAVVLTLNSANSAMMRFSEDGKHERLATAATGGLLARKRKTKISEIVQTNHEIIHRIRDSRKATAVTTTAHTRPANIALSLPRQPPWLRHLLRRSASRQPAIRAKTPTRSNQVPFAPATDRATAVR